LGVSVNVATLDCCYTRRVQGTEARVRPFVALLCVVVPFVLVAALLGGCGSSSTQPRGNVGDPCIEHEDCLDGLFCGPDGRCYDPGADGDGDGDADGDGDGDGDGDCFDGDGDGYLAASRRSTPGPRRSARTRSTTTATARSTRRARAWPGRFGTARASATRRG
jgi:hypothetical protein